MELIEKFLEAKDGRATYRSWLIKYFEIIKADPETYFKKKRNYDADILKFCDNEEIKRWAPSTKKSSIACIKTFFMFCNVRLQPVTEYSLRERCKGPKAISQERIPTRKELKEILSYGNVRHKALFLTMASSGMRPGEAVSITLSDIHLDETPTRIEIPYDATKTKESRLTFISTEAKSYVKQWLRVRSNYLKSASHRSTLYSKTEDDDRVFPFTTSTLRDMWLGLTVKAGYDALDKRNGKNRHRHKMTPHKLRKFFKSSLSNAGIPFEIAEALMGHEEGVSSVYRRYSEDQLKRWYLRGEPSLLIFERPTNQDDIDFMREQMATMQHQMESLINQTQFAKDRTENVLIAKDEYGIKRNYTEKVEESPKELLKAYQRQQKELKDIEELGPEQWAWKKKMEAKKQK